MITDYRIYQYFHKHCPKCDGVDHYSTCAGFSHDADGYLINENTVTCKCGWKGIGHDLLPRDKDLGPIKEGHVCKHQIRWPHACTFCEDQIYNIIIGKQPI